MGENTISYKDNASSLYFAMVDSIDKLIEELQASKKRLEDEYANKTNKKDMDTKVKKLAKIEKDIHTEEELKEKLSVAYNYLNDPKLDHLAEISECISNARDSLLTAEEVTSEEEHKKLAEKVLDLQVLFSKENKMTKEIEKYGESVKKYLKDHKIEKQTFTVKVNNKDGKEKLSWGVKRLFTNLLLSIYDAKREVKELVDDPEYSRIITDNLEIIEHYHEMVEIGRIEKVEPIKHKRKLFGPNLKSKDETGEFELKKANEFYKVRKAVASIILLITNCGYEQEFSKTLAKLKEVNTFCEEKFNVLVDRFEKSNFSTVKSLVVVELNKDKHESEMQELQQLFFNAYEKIGKEHERLMKIANEYRNTHRISDEEAEEIEAKGKEEALNHLMEVKKIESEEDLKTILDRRDSDTFATSRNWRSNEVLAGLNPNEEMISQREFEEELMRKRAARKAMMENETVEIEQQDDKQNAFEQFMAGRNSVAETVEAQEPEEKSNVVEFKMPEKTEIQVSSKEELLRKAVAELLDLEGKSEEQKDYEIDELVDIYKETIGMTSDERAFHVLKASGKIEESSLEDALKKTYMKIVLDAQKREQGKVEAVLSSLNQNADVIPFDNSEETVRVNRM